MTENLRCVACGSKALRLVEGYEDLLRVTSDSRIWPSGGEIGQCATCGLVQKPVTAAFRQEMLELYSGYSLYFQGRGGEQKVFRNGVGAPRSEVLLSFFLQQTPDVAGNPALTWLDLGCGRGDLLRTLAGKRPNWTLHGADLGERNKENILKIPGVRQYYSNGVDGIAGDFDVISLSHVLEHVFEPVSFLRNIVTRLAPGGHLLIASPDWKRNPFDLLVADHCLLLTEDRLADLLRASGLHIVAVRSDVIFKELVLVARVEEDCAGQESQAPREEARTEDWDDLQRTVRELSGMAAWARERQAESPIGLFGTALAATWLDASLGGSPAFWVEEDADRCGCVYLGRPVLQPREVPADAVVLVPLPAGIATAICARLNDSGSGHYLAFGQRANR